jgi:hypothetical protein
MYFRFLLALDRVKALAPQHPEWKTEEPYASLLELLRGVRFNLSNPKTTQPTTARNP